MNLYGFHRVASIEKGIYYHPLFLPQNRTEVLTIRRYTQELNEIKEANILENEIVEDENEYGDEIDVENSRTSKLKGKSNTTNNKSNKSKSKGKGKSKSKSKIFNFDLKKVPEHALLGFLHENQPEIDNEDDDNDNDNDEDFESSNSKQIEVSTPAIRRLQRKKSKKVLHEDYITTSTSNSNSTTSVATKRERDEKNQIQKKKVKKNTPNYEIEIRETRNSSRKRINDTTSSIESNSPTKKRQQTSHSNNKFEVLSINNIDNNDNDDIISMDENASDNSNTDEEEIVVTQNSKVNPQSSNNTNNSKVNNNKSNKNNHQNMKYQLNNHNSSTRIGSLFQAIVPSIDELQTYATTESIEMNSELERIELPLTLNELENEYNLQVNIVYMKGSIVLVKIPNKIKLNANNLSNNHSSYHNVLCCVINDNCWIKNELDEDGDSLHRILVYDGIKVRALSNR